MKPNQKWFTAIFSNRQDFRFNELKYTWTDVKTLKYYSFSSMCNWKEGYWNLQFGGKCATSAQEEHQSAAHWMQFQWFRAMLYIGSIAVLNALAIFDQKIIKTNLLSRRGSKLNIKIIFCVYMRILFLNYSEHKEVLSPCVYSSLYFIMSNDNIWSYVAGTHMTSGLLKRTFTISGNTSLVCPRKPFRWFQSGLTILNEWGIYRATQAYKH